MTLSIGFAGLSHLGIVSSIAAAGKGHGVVGYDPALELVEGLSQGVLPILEPGLPELFSACRPRIRFTHDAGELRNCDLIFLAADVPTDENNRSDLSPLGLLIDEVVTHASTGTILIVMSQVPPGFTRRLAEALERAHAERAFALFYQAETLIIGRAVERALHPERLIVGCRDPNQPLPETYNALLRSFGCPVLPMRYESAELAKISINAVLASSISMTNSLAELCEATGADWSEVVPALQLDRRIGPHAYLKPGLGLSGGNLERDLATLGVLAAEYGTDGGVVNACLSSSSYWRGWAPKLLHSEVTSRRPTVAVWGLAYKADTTSTKNSPALALVEGLHAFPIQVYDPCVVLDPDGLPDLVQCDSALDACRGADALAIMTPWREFSSADLAQVRELMSGSVIIDPFGVLNGNECRELGFAYYKLGVQAKAPQPVA